jgi:O-antigen/teichoic acid export membrane protein
MLGLVPVAVGAAVLSGPLVRLLLTNEFEGASLLLALGIWRAPLLALAYLYQTTLIAVNREGAGVRLLLAGAACSAPLVALSCGTFGLVGASSAVLVIGLSLVAAGYLLLRREGRQPAWHHHLARPLASALVMAPVCLVLERWHVLLAVAGGGVTYLVALTALGGLGADDLRAIFARTPAARSAPRRLGGLGSRVLADPAPES